MSVTNPIAVGIVVNNQDPENLCRVKVRIPAREDFDHCLWAQLCTPMAGNDRGMVMIPEVGDEVLLAFEHDDHRSAYVLGGLWNRADGPPLANADGRNDGRLFQSRKKHRLFFDDGNTGAVELAHEKGHKIRLDDEGIVIEDNSGNRIRLDSATGSATIEASKLIIKVGSVVFEGFESQV
jgi:uncharacterized protein involved in type VI secretion and phage assembly